MATPVTTEAVSYSSGSRTLTGHLARPEGAGKSPGVVVIHEAWGLNADITRIVDDLAGEGYVALGADLFSASSSRPLCMARLISGMFVNTLDHRGIRDLKASLDYLQKRPDVDDERVGAIGFCMGGSYAIAWACTDDRLKAIAPYYAVNPRPMEAVQRLCPVVGSYPENDFTAKHGRKLDRVLDGYDIEHDIKVYPATKHSFYRREGHYDPAAAEDSMSRVLAFFAEHLSVPAAAP
jgi:carboxymethylenebutenolidase